MVCKTTHELWEYIENVLVETYSSLVLHTVYFSFFFFFYPFLLSATFFLLIDFWERWSNTLSRVLFMEKTTLTWSIYSSCCSSFTICQSAVDGQSWPWSPRPSLKWRRAETPNWRECPSTWLACVLFLTTCFATTPRLPCTFLNRLIAYFLMLVVLSWW